MKTSNQPRSISFCSCAPEVAELLTSVLSDRFLIDGAEIRRRAKRRDRYRGSRGRGQGGDQLSEPQQDKAGLDRSWHESERRSIVHGVRQGQDLGLSSRSTASRFGKRDLLLLDQLLQLSDSRLRLLEFPAKTPGATERLWTTHLAGELCWTRFLP